MRVDLTDKVNPAFKDFFASHALDLVAYGGADAGKSYAAAQKLILKCVKYPKRRIVVIRKTLPAIRDTCWKIINDQLETWGLADVVRARQSPYEHVFPNGSAILYRSIADTSGGDPAARIKSLTDVTDIWFEEPTELSFEEFQQAYRRLRGGDLTDCYPQRIYTFNPVDANHWLKSYFFDGNKGQRLKYTYRDNTYIDQNRIDQLEELKKTNIVQWNVYANGQWGVLGHQVYSNYEVSEDGFELDPEQIDHAICGLDFGYESPSAWLFLAVKEHTCFVRGEVYEKRLKNSELIDHIRARADELAIDVGKIPCFADAAEPARIAEFEDAGFLIYPAEKPKGGRIDGINKVQSFHLVIHPDCTNTIKEIGGYARQVDRNGNVLEEPVKFNDHAMDALRYGVYTYFLTEAMAKEIQYEPEPDEYEMEGAF